MKKLFLLVFSTLPLLLTAQSTTTFWTDNCESTTGWSTSTGGGNWGLSSDLNYQGTYCFETAAGVNYASSQTSYFLESPAIDISAYTQCKLSVYMKILTEDTYDGGYLQISGDNGSTWTKMYNEQMSIPYDGKLSQDAVNVLGSNLAWYNDLDWSLLVVDLADFEGSTNLKFRFSFGSDPATDDRGMFIDQASIYGYAKTTIHNSGGADQLVFDNSYLYIEDPTFRLSSDIAATFDRFKIEINKSPQFSDISHVQEFNTSYNSGSDFTQGTEYNITCNQLNPPITFEDNTTYYVRAAASDDGGSTWGKWSNMISFTYKTTQSSYPQWHQLVDWQFENNTLDGVESNENMIDYLSSVAISQSIAQTTDDAYYAWDDFSSSEVGFYDESDKLYIGYDDINWYTFTAGLRFQNIEIPQGATITKSFIVVDCNYPDNPGYGTSVETYVDVFADDVDNSSTFTSLSTPADRTKTTASAAWDITEVWYDYSYYQTPDLTSITQEIVNRASWASGNSMSYIIEDKGGNSEFRKIRTIDSDPSHAAKLYVEYENTSNGTITSTPIYLASFDGATNWGTLLWDEEGSAGDFTVTIQEYSGGTWSDIHASYTNLGYSATGHDISALSNSIIRLVGTFTPSSGSAPSLNSWTITTQDLSTGTSDLTLSLNADDLTPCEQSEIEYTLSVANNGPDEASGIVVDFSIPAGLTFVSSAADKGSYNSTSEQWTIDALQDAETAVLTINVIVDAGQGGNTIASSPAVNTLMQTDDDATNDGVSLDVVVSSGTAPQISAITSQQTSFNTVFTTINYTVTDAETSSDLLSYSALADNTSLIPTTNFSFGGSGTNRTLDITPGTNQYGISEVTITVDDGTCASTETFSAQVVRHQYTNMESASLVIGQPNFTTVTAVTDASTTPGASSCMVSPLGYLAVGSQHTSAFQGDDGRIMLWNSLPTSDGVACNVVLGKSSVTSEVEGCSSSLTRAVDGVAFSADGNKLLASDRGNNRVLIWNTLPTTTAEAADVVIGQTNFTTSTSGCSKSKINSPRSLVVTPDGKLFIADYGNNRVLMYNSIPTTNSPEADVVIGQDDFNSNTSGNAANKMNGPWDITISTDGKLLISDVGNNRILVFNSIPSQNGASADYVIGQEDFGISSAGLAPNKFNEPIGVTVSPTGLLAVGEFANHRVLIFNEVPQENGASADVVLGQDDFYTGVEYNNGSGASGSAADNNFENPYTIYFDINDRLFVNGRDMNRVMVFGSSPTEESDLEISIDSDTDAPCMGNPVSYSIEITNNGTDDATNLVANAALPSGFYYIDHEAEIGNYDPAGGNWQIPSLANGATVSLTITGTVDYSMGGQTIEAYASVRSNNQKETDYSNNSTSKGITITNNYSPFVSRIADQQSNVSTSTGVINFTVRDEDGSVSSITATSSDQSVVQDGNITIGGSGENRTIEVTPVAGVHGVASITVSVSDGTCATTETFNCSFGNLWIGKTTDWHTESNWGGEVPKTGVDVYIPASPAGGNFPLISNDVAMRDLYLESGAELNANNPVTITIERNVTNNGTVTINNGTTVISGTGITISGTGTLQMHDANLSGTITCSSNLGISGDWNRTGTFTHSSGIVTFNGTVAQTLSSTESFYSLGVDNSAGITFSSNIDVTDTLKLLNGVITASGSFTLADNLTIVRLAGSLGAAPTFGATTNVVYMGSVITGNEIPGTNTVGDFRLDASGIEVTLGSTITLNGELELTNGIISTGANSIIMASSTTADLIGGSETSFVNGTLVRTIATNTNSYNLPIGNGTATTAYLPITFINNNLVGTTTLTASVGTMTESGDNIDGNITTAEADGNNYINVVEDGLWSIVPDSEPGSGSYGVQLYFNDAIAASLTDNAFAILKRPSSSTSYADWDCYTATTIVPSVDAAGRTKASGYAERLGYTSFSQFVIASAENPLPVDLISFTGKYSKGQVALEWVTQSEFENDYFIVEKSTDAINFSELTRVNGCGTCGQTQVYQTTDINITNGTIYYRLKQVDFNGTSATKDLIVVNCPLIGGDITIYPQPAKDEINIKLVAEYTKMVDINILNSMGIQVLKNSIRIFEGSQTIPIDINSLNSGWYVLIINDGTNIYKNKITIY
jgi:uncharacterized repeat protein (TIGR01451 family)